MRKQRGRNTLFKKTVCFLLFLTVSLVLIYNLQIIPVLIPLAKAQATTEITAKVNRVIRSCIANGETDYTDIINLQYGNDGSVTALETDPTKIAKLTADIADGTVRTMSYQRMNVHIPLGNLSGGALFTGKGPNIDIRIAVSNKITCNIENEFYESGINQTLHRIVAHIEVETFALIPAATRKFTVTVDYCIAETVIVGKVPEAYTRINRTSDDVSESDIDDLYDFGATLK